MWVKICGDPLGALQKSCKYHTKRQRVGTTFVGQILPGSPWRPAKVLQIPHKTGKGRNNILPVKTCRDPLGTLGQPCKYHTKRERVGTTLRVKICRDPLGTLQKSCKYHKMEKGRNNFKEIMLYPKLGCPFLFLVANPP